MFTLQELKKSVDMPGLDEKVPTAKQLRESGIVAAIEKLGEDTEICVYQNGYVLYQVCGRSTVFPLYLCKDYFYESGENVIHLAEQFFEKESWSLRLLLEGEDRLNRNQDEKERRWNISCNAISNKWDMENDSIESVMKRLEEQEIMDELFPILTDRQRAVVWRYIFQGKTQKQISEELGVSSPAISVILSNAVRRIRKQCPVYNAVFGVYSGKESVKCLSGKGKKNAGKKA